METIVILLFSFAAGLGGVALYDTINGPKAYEDRKFRERLRNLIYYKRESLRNKISIRNLDSVSDIVGQSRFLTWIDELLKLTTLNLNPFKFLALDCGLFFVAWIVGTIILRSSEFAFLVAAFVSAVPFILLMFNKGHYANQFIQGFPDALAMMRNSVRTGQGVQSAVKTVADEGPYPINREFKRIVQDIELGGHLDECLNALYRRIPLLDIRIFVLGVIIQMEVGGNIAELFQNIAKTIRERISMKREFNALTSQAKASGVILGALPVGLGILLNLLSPGYFDAMFQQPVGKYIMGFAVFWWGVGVFIVSRMISVNLDK